MKIIKQLIKEVLMVGLIILALIIIISALDSIFKKMGYSREQVIGAAVLSWVLAIVFSGGFSLIYNLFIGFPIGIWIEKQKKYKEVKAFRVVHNIKKAINDDMDEWKDGSHWLRYEWEVNGKKYRKLIHTSKWPGTTATFYYLKNPKYAMPIPREIARFKFERELLLVSYIISFCFSIKLI